MSIRSRNSLSKSKSQNAIGFISPQSSHRTLSRNIINSPPKLSSYDSSSRSTSTLNNRVPRNLLSVNKIPMHEMFKKTSTNHTGTILPEHLYHPPRSNACLSSSPSYKIPKCSNKSFIQVVEEHSKGIPASSDYSKPLNWLSATVRGLGKGSKRNTIIDQIFKEKKKIPGPSDYKTELVNKIKGLGMSKCQGISFMSETEYLSQASPSSHSYNLNDNLVKKRTTSYKIVKPQGKKYKLKWKAAKVAGAAVGSYNAEKDRILPKSPRAFIGTDKIKTITDDISKKKKVIPGVGKYNISPCYDRIARPMKTSRF